MKLIQCVEAYTALQGLMNENCDYATAHALVQLRRALAPHVEFFLDGERRLVDEFAAKNGRGEVVYTGPAKFRFADESRAGEYARRRTELGSVEVEEEFRKFSVRAPRRITPAQLDALEAFVTFRGGGGK